MELSNTDWQTCAHTSNERTAQPQSVLVARDLAHLDSHGQSRGRRNNRLWMTTGTCPLATTSQSRQAERQKSRSCHHPHRLQLEIRQFVAAVLQHERAEPRAHVEEQRHRLLRQRQPDTLQCRDQLRAARELEMLFQLIAHRCQHTHTRAPTHAHAATQRDDRAD